LRGTKLQPQKMQFQATGIYPLNPLIIPESVYGPADASDQPTDSSAMVCHTENAGEERTAVNANPVLQTSVDATEVTGEGDCEITLQMSVDMSVDMPMPTTDGVVVSAPFSNLPLSPVASTNHFTGPEVGTSSGHCGKPLQHSTPSKSKTSADKDVSFGSLLATPKIKRKAVSAKRSTNKKAVVLTNDIVKAPKGNASKKVGKKRKKPTELKVRYSVQESANNGGTRHALLMRLQPLFVISVR